MMGFQCKSAIMHYNVPLALSFSGQVLSSSVGIRTVFAVIGTVVSQY